MSSLRNAYDRVSLSEAGFILRNLTSNGLIDGPQDANVNGSITPVKFYIQPVPGKLYVLRVSTITVSDTSSIKLNDYGSIAGPLVNGIQFFIEKNGIEVPLGIPFKSNRSLVDLGPNRDRIVYTNNTLTAYDFSLDRYAERGIELNGNSNDKFGIIIQDDLSLLTAHTFSVKGRDLTRNI